jgi:hypothetical protein
MRDVSFLSLLTLNGMDLRQLKNQSLSPLSVIYIIRFKSICLFQVLWVLTTKNICGGVLRLHE